MAGAFRVYRILCSTPPDLEAERLAFEKSLASFAERVTFPQQVLFAGASFRDQFDAGRHRAPVEDNVRMCDFFLHIFSDTWPGPAFKAYIDLAQACMADPSQPMRKVAVLFTNFAGADEKVRNFRDALAQGGKCELRDFQDPAELQPILEEIFESWWEAVQAKP
jgi:hypothetical protein